MKPGDSYVRAIKVLRDTELAKDKRVCTFKPRVTKASRAICEARDAADPAAARRGPLGMYARGVEFMERRKRAAAAAEAARLADEEKECTFRPKPATRVPGFMRVIAAKMRRGGDASFIKGDETLETRTLKKGPEEALVNATRRREGWLASPTFSLSGWAESLGITSGDVSGGGSLGKGASERSRSFGGFGGSAAGSVDGGSAENHESATVRAGGVSFPSAPADHPARRRAGAHVPIKSAMSHYGFRDAGARSATDALEDARLAAKAAEAAHAANLESLFGDVADVRDEPPPTAFAAAPPASLQPAPSRWRPAAARIDPTPRACRTPRPRAPPPPPRRRGPLATRRPFGGSSRTRRFRFRRRPFGPHRPAGPFAPPPRPP